MLRAAVAEVHSPKVRAEAKVRGELAAEAEVGAMIVDN